MFILSEVSDLVPIPPHAFGIPIEEALTNELSKKYANKVIKNLGLIVAIWDLLEIKEGKLKPGEGSAFVETRFRCVVWKPFVGEVLTGWVSDCTSEGIRVRMNFFDDIFIPKNYLYENCDFRETEKAWVWVPEEGTELFIDINEKIRFRIEEEFFTDIKPKEELSVSDDYDNQPPVAPYALIASCQTDGMGCIDWWE